MNGLRFKFHMMLKHILALSVCTWLQLACHGGELALMKTSQGNMLFQFWPEVAPKTVASFKMLARTGFYDGVTFHRIIAGFMCQSGDPYTKNPALTNYYGSGGPGYTVPAEFNAHPHLRGVLSMARGTDTNSAGSQFFICTATATYLDKNYTAFGELIDGDDVLTKIESTPVVVRNNEKSWPTQRIVITNIAILPEVDFDQDLLPDDWEYQNGLDPNNPNDVKEDPDHDGANNWQEFLAGTNPKNANSVLRLALYVQPTMVTAQFNSNAGMQYSIEMAFFSNPQQWYTLGKITGASGSTIVNIPRNAIWGNVTNTFYRVHALY